MSHVVAFATDLPRRANHFGLSEMKATFCKNISVFARLKSDAYQGVPCPQEGRFAIVTDVGCGMRWTRRCQGARIASQTNDAEAYGQVVSF
jgi:hypothetical protein